MEYHVHCSHHRVFWLMICHHPYYDCASSESEIKKNKENQATDIYLINSRCQHYKRGKKIQRKSIIIQRKSFWNLKFAHELNDDIYFSKWVSIMCFHNLLSTSSSFIIKRERENLKLKFLYDGLNVKEREKWFLKVESPIWKDGSRCTWVFFHAVLFLDTIYSSFLFFSFFN